MRIRIVTKKKLLLLLATSATVCVLNLLLDSNYLHNKPDWPHSQNDKTEWKTKKQLATKDNLLSGKTSGLKDAVFHSSSNNTWRLHKVNNKLHVADLQISPRENNPSKFNIDPIDDYVRYPCVKELEKDSTDHCVRTICTNTVCKYEVQCTFLPLTLAENVNICAYTPKGDFISNEIRKSGGFENDMVENMVNVLKSNPGMILFDLGCNLGMYTVVAAWNARRVVCLDANYDNIHMVYTTLQQANLTENVTLVWNAMSSTQGVVTLKVTKENIGGSRIIDNHDTKNKLKKEIRVRTILLDDLLPLAMGKPAFIKMDIEEFELSALKGGRNFLKNVDVRYIQMEFTTRHTRKQIVDLLAEYGFLLYKDFAGQKRVRNNEFESIKQADVFFIKS